MAKTGDGPAIPSIPFAAAVAVADDFTIEAERRIARWLAARSNPDAAQGDANFVRRVLGIEEQ